MKKNKYSALLKNMGILTIGNFGSKILSYFLVPIYTLYLTTSEYGLFDLIQSSINLLIPILTINMSAVILRFSLDENADFKSIFSIAIKISLIGILFISIILFVNSKIELFTPLKGLSIFFILLYIFSLFAQLLTAFAKGIGDLYGMTISSIVFSISLFLFTVAFLSFFSMGLIGYLLANIISNIIVSCYLVIRIQAWKYISFNDTSNKLQVEMLAYGGPLIMTTIGWWINNISDRFIVTALCGLSINGIYSVAYKLPTILSIFQNIFNQAWQLSTVDVYDKKDSNGFFRDIYLIYNTFMVLLCSILISSCRLLAIFLFSKNFYNAWIYVPFLLISVVFGSLIGVMDGIYQAVKDSRIQSVSVLIGAIFNIVCNVIFIKIFGSIGAALSTMIAYFITWVISWLYLKRYIELRINTSRHLFSYLLLFIQALLQIFLPNGVIQVVSQVSIISIIALFYYHDIKLVLVNKKRE